MQNFRLDKLKLELNTSTSNYNLSGIYNDGGAVVIGRNPVYSAKDKILAVDVAGNDNKKVTFAYNDISFDTYGSKDYNLICFVNGDDADESAGICVADTEMPPPYRGSKKESLSFMSISSDFKITRVEFTRSSADPDFFDVEIELSFQNHNYTKNGEKMELRNAAKKQKALVLYVTQNASGATSGTLTFNTSINISEDDFSYRGLPVVITTGDVGSVDWSIVVAKKMLFFINHY